MTLPDPSTLDWGSMSKAEFKRNELAYELEHEDNDTRKFKNKWVVSQKTVALSDALAVAFAVYRINNHSYVKNTQRFSEPNNTTKFSNKELVKFYWTKKLNLGDAAYLPNDFYMFEPNEQDYAAVEDALKYMQRYVMLGLGDLDEFKRTMIQELSRDTIPVSGMGRIAYAPEFVARDQQENDLKKKIRVEYRNSVYLGKEKDSVDCVIKILDQRWSTQWETYNYTAVTSNGNLVSFMNKFDHPIGTHKRIKAKIKALTHNRLFGAQETRLNYVRLYKV